ncbi:hypothetical protein D3C80_1642750 [compost metagenome]
MPTGYFMDSPGHVIKLRQVFRAAAPDIEPDSPYAITVQPKQLFVSSIMGQLCYADKAGTQ